MRGPLLALLLAGCPAEDTDTGGPIDTADTHGHDTTDTSDTDHDTSDTDHDTSDTGHDTSDTGHDTSDTDHDTSDTDHDTSDTGHDTADTGDTGHHADTGDTDTGPHDCDVVDTGLPAPADLPDLIPLAPSNLRLTERVVTEADCAWVEGCVGGLGRRRLLRFDGSIANVGDGDLAYGRPEHHPAYFEYSLCHGHHHFTDFAAWDLRDGDGTVVATGHKQAFCLTDSGRYLDDASFLPRYDCYDQGISAGWFDVYGGHLDCQWVDVTDVPPGEYVLRVEIDPRDIVDEADDANNVVTSAVTVPATDITAPCDGSGPPSLTRECGWHLDASRTCAPGEQVTVECRDGATCGLGCAGDPMARVCEGADAQCLSGGAWAASDDGCGGDCPRMAFPCPPAGTYTTWVASYGSDVAPTCAVHAAASELPDPTTPCANGGPTGDLRECGWTSALTGACTPGDAIWVGCDPYTCGLDVCPGDDVPDTLDGMVCAGDPMLRACRGGEPCHAREALALAEDACRADCPAAVLTCPAEGQFTVLTAPERDGRTYACDLGYASVSDLNVPDTGAP